MRKPKNLNLKVFSILLLSGIIAFSIWTYNGKNSDTIKDTNYQSTATNVPIDISIEPPSVTSDTAKFTRNSSMIDYSNIAFSPWDVDKASVGIESPDKKPYTIMLYMNGSDLESESGAATDDLIEILESGLISDNANLILFTGGTNRWQNDVIPENQCMLWEIKDGQINEIQGVGLVNMGNAGTLASFIDFGIENFPAEKYGLILWDHGGGSIAGYGHDEKFDNDNLSLLDMNYAFEKSALQNTRLEFLGFDSCLMASVEMAVIASPYAKYLIASEDLTPGDGWDYSFLHILNDKPYINGEELGIAITDKFMDYYGYYTLESLNMSVIDLSNINNVMYTMGNLMQQASYNLAQDRVASFRTLAQRRNGTRTFGEGSPRDNESDMVDIGDMASSLYDLYPAHAEALFSALNESVVYNRDNSDFYLSGLSTFYIYGGKNTAGESLSTYVSLNMDSGYTEYLLSFSNILLSNNLHSQNTRSRSNLPVTNTMENIISTDITIWTPSLTKENSFIMTGIKTDIEDASEESINKNLNGLWPMINGKYVCMYKIDDNTKKQKYAIPASVNGKDGDIIVIICPEYPQGKIMGVRYEDGFVIQKGYDKIKSGSRISLYYPEKYFFNNSPEENDDWYKDHEFTTQNELTLTWQEINSGNYYSIDLRCIQNQEHFSDLKPYIK